MLLLCWRDTSHPQGGGSEWYLRRVAEGLAAAGHRVIYRTAHYPGAARREVQGGVEYSRGGGRLTVYPRAWGAILAGRFGIGPLAGVRPDVVVDTQNGIPFGARLVCSAPVVLLVHHVHREQWPVAGRVLGAVGWWIESRVSPWLHRRAQWVTVSTPSATELAELGVAADRIAVVRNGVDAVPGGVSVSDPARDPMLVVLSRLVPHKQIEDALVAVAELAGQFPRIRLEIIGDGWWSDQLRDLVRSLAIADRVVFHGHVSEERKHEILATAWVHLMPSRKEGWGLAVMEAARHGVPTVGYRHSRGLADSIIDRVTGRLVDSPAELAEVTGELLADAAGRRRLGESARRRSGEFSWDSTILGFTEVMSAAMEGRMVSGVHPAAAATAQVLDA